MKSPALTITYSLADQSFSRTKSLGILNLSLQLLEHLAVHPEIARLTVLGNQTLAGISSGLKSEQVQDHSWPLRHAALRIIWDQWGAYHAAKAAGNEWLFLPKGFASFARRPPVKLATCIADVMHDHYARHHPSAVSRFESRYFEKCFIASLRHSQVIFTISEFTRSEVKRVAASLGIALPPIHAMGIGFTRPTAIGSVKQDRVVVLAGRFPHKRTDLAVKYLAEWQHRENYTGEVHWVGGFPEGLTLPDYPNWKRHQRMPEVDYRDLLATAKALVYFSEYEGFGMPPVEAALAGVCPVYSDLPVTREVMNSTGKTFQNEDFSSFAEALNGALATSGEVIAGWGGELLQRHNWPTVGARVIKGMSVAD